MSDEETKPEPKAKIEVGVFEVRALLSAHLSMVGEIADELIEAVELENDETDDIMREMDLHYNKAGAALDLLSELLGVGAGEAEGG